MSLFVKTGTPFLIKICILVEQKPKPCNMKRARRDNLTQEDDFNGGFHVAIKNKL
jgi:hypothetical protein